MAPSYGSLVKQAIKLLDEFSAGRQHLDDFMEEVSKDLQDMDVLQRKFILDVVSGCAEYKKLLDVVINVFYGQKGKYLSRRDRSQFVIICYLATFALDDLGIQQFSNIVKSLDTKKMHMFLTFFLTNLTMWIQEEWNKSYDAAFVEEHWIRPLLRWRPEIDILMNELALKVSQGGQVKKEPVKTTKPQEFSLTKPKAAPLPLPELIPQLEKSKPVPSSTHRTPKEMLVMEEVKQKNRQKSEELLLEANTKQFRCVNLQKSEHTKRVISKIKEEMDSKLQFNSFQCNELPLSNKTSNWPIKLNNAAILRQRALYDCQVEEERQRIERLVQGAGDPSSLLQWQREMRDKDLQEELDRIERRHVGQEEAAMARSRLMERNQKTAQLKKEETAQLMQQYAEKRLQEEKEMRDLVQQVAEGHKNSKIAKEKLQGIKQRIVKEVSEQNQELLRQALEAAQAELSRRFEMIQEIRVIESLPPIRLRNFDNTEVAGHELLGEMSLAELKERLAIQKEARQAEQQEKREHILKGRQEKTQLLSEHLDAIDFHRRALAQAAAIRKEEKRSELEWRRKLEEKKQERRRLKQSENMKKQFSLEELELSLERHIQVDNPHEVPLTKTHQT